MKGSCNDYKFETFALCFKKDVRKIIRTFAVLPKQVKYDADEFTIGSAFNYLENTGTNIFLTGKAGTGKTTFLKKLKETSLNG